MPDTQGEASLIALDFDGVIADTNLMKVEWIRRHLHLEVPPALCNRTDCVPLIGRVEYEAMTAEVYELVSTMAAPEVEGVRDALRTLADGHELMVVTARTEERLGYAVQWLESQGLRQYFSDMRTSAGGPAKVEIAAAAGASVLVDDDPRHLLPDAAHRLRLFLFSPDYQRDLDPDSGIISFDSWRELVGRLIDPDH